MFVYATPYTLHYVVKVHMIFDIYDDDASKFSMHVCHTATHYCYKIVCSMFASFGLFIKTSDGDDD